MENIIKDRFSISFTHSGKFHADDVFATAFLKILNPEVEINRGYKVPEKFNGIVYDIGEGEFDHHQSNCLVRENNIPYAAFGLLWNKFGYLVVSKKQVKRIDEKFIQTLDLCDNTSNNNPLSFAISCFNSFSLDSNNNNIFEKVVSIAKEILEAIINDANYLDNKEQKVIEFYEKSDKFVVIMDYYIPWKGILSETEAKFVIFPSDRGGYIAQIIERDENTIFFPKSWSGLSEKELERKSNIKGLKFCHKNCYLIRAENVDILKEAIEAAVKEANKREGENV